MALHVMDEANRCLGCKVPQCQKGCPISTPIPEVIKLLKANKLDEAGKMLFENNPLTTVCSLVCNHENQCEGHCVLGRKGAPVHFSTIESYISTTYANKMTQGPDMAMMLLFLKEKIKLAVSFVTVSRNSVCQNLSWMILNTAT